jgi:two-component system phosphate regulon response regulator PhoB
MNTVLIIDDDADFRCLMGEILKAAGWQVLEAGAGEQGVELARRRQPEVVLCDLRLPGVDGLQICRALRHEPGLRHARIMVTSGSDLERDRQAAREAGADEYLTKPFPTERLLELLAPPGAAGEAGKPQSVLSPESKLMTQDPRLKTRNSEL